MTPLEFIRKWRPVALTERQAAQEHFIDLCRLVGHPTPIEDDPSGESYCFEKGALKSSGNPGFADVWKRGHFAFEYKKKKKNLGEALKQLSQYAWNLENPPLNVVCDTNAIRIVTAWTNTLSRTFDLTLDDLADPEKFWILDAVFHDPEKLRAHQTREMLTKEAADKFSGLAERLQSRGHPPEAVAHFVMQLVFCFFAEDVRLLPDGFFRKALRQLNIGARHEHAKAMLDDIFSAMASKGGRVGNDFLPYFNGGLFDHQPALPLDEGDVGLLVAVGSMRWAEIDPSIFGTLFERFLDPAKRAQIGAHYTDTRKILQIVEPVVMRPLEAEWLEVKARIETLAAAARAKGAKAKEWRAADEERTRFVEKLASLRILDPACGSGNFLYMALQLVKDLEFRVDNECGAMGLQSLTPRVGPEILFGIEINRLAAEIARTTIWIGDIQWSMKHALYSHPEPVLRKLDQIECRDAILDQKPDGSFAEARWPEVDFIIGNPPFLGCNKFKEKLGPNITDELRRIYNLRVPNTADLVCYWFLKAFTSLKAGDCLAFGLIATSAIRAGNNLKFLNSIYEVQNVFSVWSDEPWILDGANVRVSIICASNNIENVKFLDGLRVQTINSDLTGSVGGGFAQIARLPENQGLAFQGSKKVGNFEVDYSTGKRLLDQPINVNGKSNVEVVKRSWLSKDFMTRDRGCWIIDFGVSMSENDASYYEAPYKYLVDHIKAKRVTNARATRSKNWWRHGDPQPKMRDAITRLRRYIVTPEVHNLRVFCWADRSVLPDCKIIVIAVEGDTAFGIVCSRFHVAWSKKTGGVRGKGRTYTPTRTFETYPFPQGLTPNIPAADYAADPRAVRIGQAAKNLDDLRRAWLNPPDLIKIEPEVVPGYPDRILPKDADAAQKLKERTLTNLYNQRPQWLANAHESLDRAVAAAYGWPEEISTEKALEMLLALNLSRATPAKKR